MGLTELAINRVAVPMLRPLRGEPPPWHTALDYLGLFLFYFASLLAVVGCGLRLFRVLDQRGAARLRELVVSGPLIALGLCSVWAIVVASNQGLTLAMELCLGAVVLVAAARGVGHFLGARRDLGVALGVGFLILPVLAHLAMVLGARWLWADAAYDGAPVLARYGTLALTIAGLVSPYCLAPRPFVRSVTRLPPVAVAISVALLAAWLLRADYFTAARVLKLSIGFELETGRADPQLTLYLLATATMAWTITSCAMSPRPGRKTVAVALGLLALGGTAYQWPLHYLLLALGATMLADVAAPLHAAENSALAVARGHGLSVSPVDDATWGRYLATVATVLRRRVTSLHTLTTRAPDGSTSTVLIGEADGRTIRARIDREQGAVLGVDLALGRDLEAVPSTPTLTVVSDDPLLLADAPSAGPELTTADQAFDHRFRCQGSAAALAQLFDDGLRARATALLDGWLVFVERRSLRYRSYPGRSGAVEHFLPLADLAQGRVPPGAGERALVIFELLLELAARGQLESASDGESESAFESASEIASGAKDEALDASVAASAAEPAVATTGAATTDDLAGSAASATAPSPLGDKS